MSIASPSSNALTQLKDLCPSLPPAEKEENVTRFAWICGRSNVAKERTTKALQGALGSGVTHITEEQLSSVTDQVVEGVFYGPLKITPKSPKEAMSVIHQELKQVINTRKDDETGDLKRVRNLCEIEAVFFVKGIREDVQNSTTAEELTDKIRDRCQEWDTAIDEEFKSTVFVDCPDIHRALLRQEVVRNSMMYYVSQDLPEGFGDLLVKILIDFGVNIPNAHTVLPYDKDLISMKKMGLIQPEDLGQLRENLQEKVLGSDQAHQRKVHLDKLHPLRTEKNEGEDNSVVRTPMGSNRSSKSDFGDEPLNELGETPTSLNQGEEITTPVGKTNLSIISAKKALQIAAIVLVVLGLIIGAAIVAMKYVGFAVMIAAIVAAVTNPVGLIVLAGIAALILIGLLLYCNGPTLLDGVKSLLGKSPKIEGQLPIDGSGGTDENKTEVVVTDADTVVKSEITSDVKEEEHPVIINSDAGIEDESKEPELLPVVDPLGGKMDEPLLPPVELKPVSDSSELNSGLEEEEERPVITNDKPLLSSNPVSDGEDNMQKIKGLVAKQEQPLNGVFTARKQGVAKRQVHLNLRLAARVRQLLKQRKGLEAWIKNEKALCRNNFRYAKERREALQGQLQQMRSKIDAQERIIDTQRKELENLSCKLKPLAMEEIYPDASDQTLLDIQTNWGEVISGSSEEGSAPMTPVRGKDLLSANEKDRIRKARQQWSEGRRSIKPGSVEEKVNAIEDDA